MTNEPQQTIGLDRLIELRDRVARLHNPDREVDADLFRLFDRRPVIKTRRTVARFVAETDWLGLAEMEEDVFASETHGCETRDSDSSPAKTERSPFGILDQNGNFVREPVLRLIPEYTSAFDVAFLFKQSIVGCDYPLRFSEVEGPLLPEFEAGLYDLSGDLRSSHVSQDIAIAIVKVCLDFLIADPQRSSTCVVLTDENRSVDVER